MPHAPVSEGRATTPRLGWIGFHVEGVDALRALLARQAPVAAVVTLTPEAAGRRCGAADYQPLCREHGVPMHRVANINDDSAIALLRELRLDIAFVIGWTQLVGPAAMAQVSRGLIGAHASLLPYHRGRAPINWALIEGLTTTGNTLLWLDEHADRGDIIDQTLIAVSPYDTCATLYDKVAASNTQMILGVLPRLLRGERPGQPQPPSLGPDLPGRRPADGVVDWCWTSARIYDFIRALTRPYPGAWAWLDDRRWRLWSAARLPGVTAGARPGEILGPVVSPEPHACGLAVACGSGAVVLREIEDDCGHVLAGTALSDQPWQGKTWRKAAS